MRMPLVGSCVKVATSRLEMVLSASMPPRLALYVNWYSSTGTGGESIYGEKFADEAFPVKHTKPFLLSMVSAPLHQFTRGDKYYS